MKILFNIMTLNKGGAERVVNILANNFANHNNVKIMCHVKSDIEYEFDDNVKIDFLSNQDELKSKIKRLIGKVSIMKMLKAAKIIKEFEPDVIISFLPEPSLKILLLKKIAKKRLNYKIIVSERNDPATEYHNRIMHFIMKKLFAMADGFVFQTRDAQKYFNNIIKCNSKIILNPIDDSFINSSISKKRVNEIVTVGRIVDQKNHFLLIDSYMLFSKKHPDYILKIYGNGINKEKLQKYIDENKMHSKILLMGNVSNVKKHIIDSSLFILSSNYEGLPNALMEAMALGLPCISTDCPCGGPRMIINNRNNGILVPLNNKESMANAMCELIENKELANNISLNAKEWSKQFAKEKIIEEWINYINEVIK